jgi:hypothetical protein
MPLPLESLCQPFFVKGFFEIGSLKNIYGIFDEGEVQTSILLISAS